MFKLNSKKYADMIEAYKKMENLFEEEKQYLLGEVEQTAGTMEGSAISSWRTGSIDFFGHGAYADAMEQVKGLRTSMKDMQPLVNRIVAEGLLFADQLEADAMIFPGDGEVSGEEWIWLDEAYEGTINSVCDQVQETRKSLETTMKDIRDSCNGIVDIGEEVAQFEEARKALKRVETFHDAFKKYVRDVHELDENLRWDFDMLVDMEGLETGKEMKKTLSELCGCLQVKELKEILEKDPLEWTEEENRIASAAWSTAVEERDTETIRLLLDACRDGESGRVDHHRMGYLREYTEGESREILSALMEDAENLPEWTYAEYLIDVMEEGGCLTIIITQDVLLEKDNRITVTSDRAGAVCRGPSDISSVQPRYDEDYYKTAAELLEKDGEGRYAFESLLRQDAGEIGEREKEILSLLYQDKCRVVETAPSRESREGQFEVAERFVEGMFRYQVYLEGQYCKENAYMDAEWSTAMLSYMEDNSSFAGQTLLQLSEYKEEKGRGWIKHGADALDNVVILPHKTGLTMDLEFHPIDARNKAEQASIYIGSKDRATMYVRNLDPDTFDHLALMGYSCQEIIDTYLLAGSVTDEDFIDCVMKAEYRDAFRMDPEELGDKTKLMLSQHTLKLCRVTNMENGLIIYPELEKFINGMLYQDEIYLYTDKYVVLMTDQSELLPVLVDTAELQEEDRCRESRNGMYLNSFWESLYYVYTKSDIMTPPGGGHPWYSSGECMLQVRGLHRGLDNDMCYHLVLCSPDGAGGYTDYREKEVTAMVSMEPSLTDQKERLAAIRSAKERSEMAWMNYTIDTFVSVMGVYLPRLANRIGAIAAFAETDYTKTLRYVERDALLDPYRTQKGDALSRGFLGVLSAFEKGDALRKETDDEVLKGLIPWFYSSVTCRVNDCDEERKSETADLIYLSEQVNNYDVLESIDRWNQEGISSFVNLKEVAQYSTDKKTIRMSEAGLTDKIYEYIKDNVDCSPEQKEVIKFLLKGKTGETGYESVLDIDGSLFLDGVMHINENIRKALAVDITKEFEVDLRKEWQNQF